MIHLLPILLRARRRVPLRTPAAPPEPSPNLLLWSEQFQQAAWGASGVTVTADQVNDPNDLLTADLLNPENGLGRVSQLAQGGVSPGLTDTLSVYILMAPGHTGGQTRLQINDGVASSLAGFVATASWERVSLTYTTSLSATTLEARIIPDTLGTAIYAWGAKLEEGNLTDYVKREDV